MNKIMVSNDTYFYMLARDLGVNSIANFMKPFGFGQITGIDIQGEARGILPSTDWKKKAFKKAAQQKWFDGETIRSAPGSAGLQLVHDPATRARDRDAREQRHRDEASPREGSRGSDHARAPP